MMAKLTFQIDDIVAEYEFPTDAPVLEFVHMFNQRLGTPDASDVDQVQECLYWLADHLYGTAKQQYIEQERAKAITELRADMNSDDLRAEKTQMEQSLANWTAELSQAQERAALAQRQIDVHTGHIERINMWLAKLEQQAAPKKAELQVEWEKLNPPRVTDTA